LYAFCFSVEWETILVAHITLNELAITCFDLTHRSTAARQLSSNEPEFAVGDIAERDLSQYQNRVWATRKSFEVLLATFTHKEKA